MAEKAQKKRDLSLLPTGGKIYFVGIGGISMSGLSEIAKNLGYRCGGADMHLSPRTDGLKSKGIHIYPGHSAENLKDFQPDLVVHTAAILPGNPELCFAAEKEIPMMTRAEFLGCLTASYKKVINISGTHGKTTTTAMTTLILLEAGIDPTMHLGADLPIFENTVHMGKGNELLVSEACEFQRSFLAFYSTTAAVTNIDYDHVDCYANLSEVIDVFAEFTKKLAQDGTLIVPAFDKNAAEAIRRIPDYRSTMPNIITTGKKEDIFEMTGKHPDVYAENIHYQNGCPVFDVYINDQFYTDIELAIPGDHNIFNALTAIACAMLHGGNANSAKKALAGFVGADGRYTIKGTFLGATVVADYAHHPAAARATLAAASNVPHKKTWVVFQPLTYKRTEVLFEDYVTSLLPCEHIIFAEIFSDREINPGTISSADIAAEINKRGGNAEFYPEKIQIKERLSKLVEEGDLILLLGPEDIRDMAEMLV